MNREAAISVSHLTKRFGDFTAVDRITFDVGKGEIFGFLGANGAGKTTAMRMLCGLSLPTSGRAQVAGFDLYKESEKIKKNIGYMSQKFSLYEDLTIRENNRFYGGIYGLTNQQIKEKTQFMLEHLRLEGKADTLVRATGLEAKAFLFCGDGPRSENCVFGRTDRRRGPRYAKGVLDDDLRGRP